MPSYKTWLKRTGRLDNWKSELRYTALCAWLKSEVE